MSHAASDGGELGVQRCSLQLPLRWKHDEDRKQKGSRISCCVWSQKQSGPIKSQLYFPFPKKQCAASGALRERGDHHTWNQISCWFTCDRSLSARCRSSTSADHRPLQSSEQPPETPGQDNEELVEVETDISFHAI